MRAKDKERLARRQRMLARERGEPLPDVFAPPPRGRSRPKGADPDPEPPLPEPPDPAPRAEAGETGRTARLRPLSPLLRRRRRRRRLMLLALLLALLVGLAAVTGALRSAVALATDAADSAYLYLHRGSGWPASTGIDSPLRIEELAGGFVEMDSRDVAVYSAYGSQIRTIQPGYARPALAVGNTRFVLYDRAGTSLRVESRTRTLHTRTTSAAILLCALSANGTVAVVTESDRYVAQLQVLDPTSFEPLYTWKMTQEDGIPLAVAFAPDNRRFAVGTVAARDGQLASSVCLTGISGQEEPLLYTAESGSMLVRLHWLLGSRLLAVFDTYLALLDGRTGAELARCDYGGAELLGVSVQDGTAALLLSTHNGSHLILLDSDLNQVADTEAGQAESVTCTGTAVYLIDNNTVICYGADGVRRWEKEYDARPQQILSAAQPLLFTAGRVEVLEAPG